MLILTRRIGENIIIDGNVTLSVIGVRGGNVRLGVQAPDNVSVDREEVYLRKKQEKNGNSNYNE